MEESNGLVRLNRQIEKEMRDRMFFIVPNVEQVVLWRLVCEKSPHLPFPQEILDYIESYLVDCLMVCSSCHEWKERSTFYSDDLRFTAYCSWQCSFGFITKRHIRVYDNDLDAWADITLGDAIYKEN